MMIRVLAIDPGLSALGFAITLRWDSKRSDPQTDKTIAHGCYKPPGPEVAIRDRLKQITMRIMFYMQLHKPDVVLLEDMNYKKFSRGWKGKAGYGAAWGAIASTLVTLQELSSRENHAKSRRGKGIGISPFIIKIVAIPKGNPRMKKRSRKLMIRRLCELNYKIFPKTDHEAEAIWWSREWDVSCGGSYATK